MRKHFTAEQARELTLDVMRNASNKIAVALEADAPRVEDGTERYVIDVDGQTQFASWWPRRAAWEDGAAQICIGGGSSVG